MATVTIKWLEQEIQRLEADLTAARSRANQLQTQANYQESIDPDLSFVSEQTADQYRSEAEDIEAKIAEHTNKIEELKQQVGQLTEERDRLRREADDKDREIINING